MTHPAQATALRSRSCSRCVSPSRPGCCSPGSRCSSNSSSPRCSPCSHLMGDECQPAPVAMHVSRRTRTEVGDKCLLARPPPSVSPVPRRVTNCCWSRGSRCRDLAAVVTVRHHVESNQGWLQSINTLRCSREPRWSHHVALGEDALSPRAPGQELQGHLPPHGDPGPHPAVYYPLSGHPQEAQALRQGEGAAGGDGLEERLGPRRGG